jgi:hypothetical protein
MGGFKLLGRGILFFLKKGRLWFWLGGWVGPVAHTFWLWLKFFLGLGGQNEKPGPGSAPHPPGQ